MAARASLTLAIIVLSIQGAASAAVPHSVSFGFGMPYGMAGLNGEVGGRLAAMAGIGVVMHSRVLPGWCVGGRLNLPLGDRFRFRFNLLYGTAVLVEKPGEDEAWAKLAYGPGFRWRSFQLDVIVVEAEPPPGYYQKGGDVKIAFGFALPLTRRPAADPAPGRNAADDFAPRKD